MPHDAPYRGGYHPYKSFGEIMEEKERARFAEFPRQGAHRRPYGLDHLGMLYFDAESPYISGWARSTASEILFYPDRSDGRVYADGGELVVRV